MVVGPAGKQPDYLSGGTVGVGQRQVNIAVGQRRRSLGKIGRRQAAPVAVPEAVVPGQVPPQIVYAALAHHLPGPLGPGSGARTAGPFRRLPTPHTAAPETPRAQRAGDTRGSQALVFSRSCPFPFLSCLGSFVLLTSYRHTKIIQEPDQFVNPFPPFLHSTIGKVLGAQGISFQDKMGRPVLSGRPTGFLS